MALLVATVFGMPEAHAQERKFDLSLPADSLIEALKRLRALTESPIVYSPQQLDGARAAGLSGSYTVSEALAELLKQTGFTFKLDERGTIVVVPVPKPVDVSEPPPPLPVRLPPPPIEEITVTAEKREEAAKDVPESVSALTGSTLTQRGLNGIDDYGSFVPGLTLLSNQRGFGQIVLRGITTGTTQPTASVGTYIDDVPYGSSTAFQGGNLVIADIDPFDVQRVEVARGPQGTLYGAGTLAGVLKFVTTPPKLDSWEGQGEIDLGGTDGGGFDQAAKVMANAPLGDRAALRIDLYERRDSGYIDDIGLGNRNEDFNDVRGGRISLLARPADDLTIRFTSLYQERHVGGTPDVDINAVTGQPTVGDLDQSRFIREVASQQYQLHQLSVSWDLGAADLSSSTSFGRSLAHAVTDNTLSAGPTLQLVGQLPAIPVVAAPTSFTTDKFTEEIRLTSAQNRSFNWLVGTFYTYEWSDARASLEASLPGVTLPAIFAHPLQSDEPSRFREYAAFGDVDYYFTPTVDLTAGARWSRNRQSFDQTNSGFLNAESLLASNALGASAGSSWTYRLAPRWRITDELTTYAEASSGYRPGGPNVQPPRNLQGVGPSPASFGADTLWNYEVGVKSELFDKRLAFDVDAYVINWRHIQLQSQNNGFPFETNGGAATSRGTEFEAGYRPFNGLVLGLAGAYTYATFAADAPSVDGVKGEPLPSVPRWSGAVTADYTFPAFGAWDATVGASYRRIGDRDFQTPDLQLPAYGELDLRVGLAVDNSTISLFVDNVLNERGAVDVEELTSSPSVPAHLAVIRPLSIGLQITTAL